MCVQESAVARCTRFAMPRPDRSNLSILVVLLASFVTALVSHAAIDAADRHWIGPRSYESHAHGALAPAAVLAIFILIALLCTLLRLARRAARSDDPAFASAASIESLSSIGGAGKIACGGLAILMAMEYAEHACASREAFALVDSLGGNAPFGVLVVTIIATVVSWIAFRLVGWLFSGAMKLTHAFAAGPIARRGERPSPLALRQYDRRARTPSESVIGRARGLRAPPALIPN